jgi:ABC-type branched-subunit amino acid transport system substrate-binding protein
MAKALAKITTQTLNRKKIVILTAVNCSYCVDLSNTFTEEIKKYDGEIVKNISVIQEDTDFSSVAKIVKDLTQICD